VAVEKNSAKVDNKKYVEIRATVESKVGIFVPTKSSIVENFDVSMKKRSN
jgi:hypothetical protein